MTGDLGVGDDDAVVFRGCLRVGVGELRVQRDAEPCGGLGPLDLEVLGGDDDRDGLDGALGEQFGRDAQSEGRLAGARASRPPGSHVVWRPGISPAPDAASPVKPGCWALRQPAPEDSSLTGMQSRAGGSATAYPLGVSWGRVYSTASSGRACWRRRAPTEPAVAAEPMVRAATANPLCCQRRCERLCPIIRPWWADQENVGMAISRKWLVPVIALTSLILASGTVANPVSAEEAVLIPGATVFKPNQPVLFVSRQDVSRHRHPLPR